MYLTLVFPWGINQRDPEKRLNGEGKHVRHIRLVPVNILDDPYVLALIYEAAEQSKREEMPNGFTKTIKEYEGPMRR